MVGRFRVAGGRHPIPLSAVEGDGEKGGEGGKVTVDSAPRPNFIIRAERSFSCGGAAKLKNSGGTWKNI